MAYNYFLKSTPNSKYANCRVIRETLDLLSVLVHFVLSPAYCYVQLCSLTPALFSFLEGEDCQVKLRWLFAPPLQLPKISSQAFFDRVQNIGRVWESFAPPGYSTR